MAYTLTKKRIAIIGAGASGLPTIKSCLEEGMAPTCFERSDNIGGLWAYKESTEAGFGCVMRSTIMNTSKEISAFSDFPPPKHFANFMPHRQVIEYLESYARKFDLLRHIRFRSHVILVSRATDYEQTGKWQLQWRDLDGDKEHTEMFDAVSICTGHHGEPNQPSLKGHQKFQGELMHAYQYRAPENFKDKTVLVVGIGNSGADIAVELSRIAQQVYISTRRGAWVTPRIVAGGLPASMVYARRVVAFKRKLTPTSMNNSRAEKACNQRFNHATYGMQPQHRFSQQHPVANDELANRISCGKLQVKCDVSYLTETGVTFKDGSAIGNVDVIILATGYRLSFPFMEEGVLPVKDNAVELYSNVFPPRLPHPSLAVVGLVQPAGSIFPCSEMQARWVARVFKGHCTLPPQEVMLKHIRKRLKNLQRRFVKSTRHTIEVDYISYMDEVASRIGCKPNIGGLLKDPKLAYHCYFGPCTSYQFRIQGPHPWPGAREAIMNTLDRVLYPTQTRTPLSGQKSSETWAAQTLTEE